MSGDYQEVRFGDDDPEDAWSEEDEVDSKIQVLELTIISVQVERDMGDVDRAEVRRRGAIEAVGRTLRLLGLTERQEDRLSEIADVLEELGRG